MTVMEGRPRLVVGIDGSHACLVATRYAATEARRIGATIELAHTTPGLAAFGMGIAMMYPTSQEDYRAAGTKLLNHARTVAREVAGDEWDISTSLHEGPPAQALAIASRGAAALILGDQRRTLVDRLITGSVTSAAAGLATVPLVVVPETWVPAEPKDVIAVGVRNVERCEPLLRVAFRTAVQRSARLRVVHAWELPAEYDSIIATRIDAALMRDYVRAGLDAVLERVRPDFPHVDVDLQLVHGQPAHALERASADVDLVVIARRGHAIPFGYLGGTGRALLRVTRCPVEIVPPSEVEVRAAAPAVLEPQFAG